MLLAEMEKKKAPNTTITTDEIAVMGTLGMTLYLTVLPWLSAGISALEVSLLSGSFGIKMAVESVANFSGMVTSEAASRRGYSLRIDMFPLSRQF